MQLSSYPFSKKNCHLILNNYLKRKIINKHCKSKDCDKKICNKVVDSAAFWIKERWKKLNKKEIEQPNIL